MINIDRTRNGLGCIDPNPTTRFGPQCGIISTTKSGPECGINIDRTRSGAGCINIINTRDSSSCIKNIIENDIKIDSGFNIELRSNK